MGKPPNSSMVVLGQFAGPHGVKGGFKVRSYTDIAADIAAYGPLYTEEGHQLTLSLGSEVKPSLFFATAPEVTSREACDRYKGALLYVARDRLPAPDEDEYYLDDLVGLKAVTITGQLAGEVKAVVNYGAGDVIELHKIPGRPGLVLLPFTKDAVPKVDLAAGQVMVVLPEEEDSSEDKG
ncbi:MAG: ribosome maturation factor RimM [Pseudomonadota bacterium]